MSSSDYHLREKLRNAAQTIRDDDRPIRDRLHSAYVYDLGVLIEDEFVDDEGRAEYLAIRAELNKYGEAIEGEGSMPTTVWTMSEQDAVELGDRIVKLARRYGEA